MQQIIAELEFINGSVPYKLAFEQYQEASEAYNNAFRTLHDGHARSREDVVNLEVRLETARARLTEIVWSFGRLFLAVASSEKDDDADGAK